MPLKKGKKNIGKNIKTEMKHGKPRKQAIAIACLRCREVKEESQKKEMKLVLSRRVISPYSTIGSLEWNGIKICDILERPWENGANRINNLGKGENNSTCILPGIYRIEKKYSPLNRCEVPILINVPGRSEIEIHTGNYPKDSFGCLLPGTYNMNILDMVSSSRDAFRHLMELFETSWDLGENIFLEIVNDFEKSNKNLVS